MRDYGQSFWLLLFLQWNGKQSSIEQEESGEGFGDLKRENELNSHLREQENKKCGYWTALKVTLRFVLRDLKWEQVAWFGGLF